MTVMISYWRFHLCVPAEISNISCFENCFFLFFSFSPWRDWNFGSFGREIQPDVDFDR
jgi:hypothetical protein